MMKYKGLKINPSAGALGLAVLCCCIASAEAELVTQATSQGGANAAGWNASIWGTPAAPPVPGNDYLVPSGFTLRTPNYSTNMAFPGDTLIITNGGTLAFKHSGGVASANLIMGPGTIGHFGGVGTTGVPPSPLGGTLNLVANLNYNATATGTPQPRHMSLVGTILGTGDFNIGNCYTSSVYLANSGENYSGDWNVTGGRLVILGGTAPLGSGVVNLVNDTNTLTLNATNDLVLTNQVIGAGGLIKQNTNTATMPGSYGFTGTLSSLNGTLVLSGTGAQTSTSIDDNGILRVTSQNAIPAGSTLRIFCNNPDTGRLELANNVTISGSGLLEVSLRNNPSVAIQSVSGNNTIQDAVATQAGGGFLGIQVDAGSTLTLAGGVTSTATGNRNFSLLGDGNGIVSASINNGSATSLALNKSGVGTWTLTSFNSYSGATHITNGTLKIAATGSIDPASAIGLEADGKLDVTEIPGGFILGANQVLRGRGAVLGNVTTSPGSLIEVGFLNQYGELSLSNNLVLSGGETNRFEIGGSNDVLNVTGTITLNGNSTILVAAPEGSIENGTYRLVNYSGTLQGGGSFTLVAPATRQTFTLVTTTPGQINLVVTGNPATVTWAGDNIANLWDIGTSQNWNAGTEVFFNGDEVIINDNGSATPDIDVVVPVVVGSLLVNNNAKSFTLTNSPITSFGPLTKQGSGTLALANDNNFRGQITIEGGTLSLGNGSTNGALGTGPITNNGELVVNRLSGGVLLAQNISGSGSLRIAPGSDTAHPTLTLRGTNTYTGLTTIETNSTITIQSDSALGDTAAGTTVLAGGRLGFTSLGPWTVPEPVAINGEGLWDFPGAIYLNTASNLATFTGPVTVESASRIRVVNNYAQLVFDNRVIGNQSPLTLSSEGTGTRMVLKHTLAIGDEAVLTKNGSGAVILAGDTNVAGSTVVDAGSLVIASTNPPTIGDITVNSGLLQIGDGGTNGALPTGLINLAGTGSNLRFDSRKDLTLDREIFGLGGLQKWNSNSLVILTSNTFAGNVTTGSGSPSPNGRGGGIIELRNRDGLGDGLAPKNVELVRAELQLYGSYTLPSTISYTISGGTFVTSEGARLIPIRSMTGNNVIEGPINVIGGAGNGEVAVESGSLTLNGNISLGGTTSARSVVLSGAGSGSVNGSIMNGQNFLGLTKEGTGTWTLNNAYNDYSGATIIQGGTLALSASATIPNTPSITLLSNAVFNISAVPGGMWVMQTLRGNGTVQGSLTAAGIVSPGNPVGTLNVTGSITLGGETIMELNRNNSQNADLLSAASIIRGGTLTITNVGPALQPGDTFDLFDGTLSGEFTFTNDLPPLASPDYFWDLSQFGTLGIIKVGSTVAQPPTILPPTLVGNNLVLTVNSLAGFTYNLEATPAVDPTSWGVVESKPGGGILTFTIPIGTTPPERFFRIRVQ